jgi:hypothetical protein
VASLGIFQVALEGGRETHYAARPKYGRRMTGSGATARSAIARARTLTATFDCVVLIDEVVVDGGRLPKSNPGIRL